MVTDCIAFLVGVIGVTAGAVKDDDSCQQQIIRNSLYQHRRVLVTVFHIDHS